MLPKLSPLTQHLRALATGEMSLAQVADGCARRANANASHNTYLHFSQPDLAAQASALAQRYAGAPAKPPLYGVPISLKDCFDLAGVPTTCGTKFYARLHGAASHDSAMATRLHSAGALLSGKTHLHPLAYGITGQNPDYGDCLQPRDATLLTGGSSSGAAASVQEGSALAAIGTDTGGSIRVPAALCGLAGYRASLALAYAPGPWAPLPEGLWQGAAHLAGSFDTPGFFVRDPRDLAPIANALFGVRFDVAPAHPRIGCVGEAFLHDCDAEVLAAFTAFQRRIAALGATVGEADTSRWHDAQEIFAPIQAHEAAAIHRGHFDAFEPAIAQRLHWGGSLTPAEIAPLRQRHQDFQARLAAAFAEFDFLVLPCAPVGRLLAADDHSSTRQRILRYTAPFSLGGVPVVALPGELLGGAPGTGMQIAAAAGRDAALLAFAGALGQSLVEANA